MVPGILALNSGSSSLRFALYQDSAELPCLLDGRIERIGLTDTMLSFRSAEGGKEQVAVPGRSDHPAAIAFLLEWLAGRVALDALQVVGLRIVHGLQRTEPQYLEPALLVELRALEAFVPEHLPAALALSAALSQARPDLPQVACFDTAFHQHMPRVATLLAVPRQYQQIGVRRYGFHGISCAFLLQELQRIGDPAAHQGRIILAHLGNGASLTAVQDGVGIDTSMGFTPASGIAMSTRSGDLDPLLASYLARKTDLDATAFEHMVNHESGLLGVSGYSSDMRDLLAAEATNPAAADAIALFCYQVQKTIGGYFAALGGLDTLVFSGGIGEQADVVRARVVERLQCLGIELDPALNKVHAAVISSAASRVRVRVIRTDETRMIARATQALLHA